MGTLRAPARRWICLSSVVCLLLALAGCVLFRRRAIQPTPGLAGLRFVIRADVDRGERVVVDLGAANEGSTLIPANSRWVGYWSIAGPTGEVTVQGRVSSLPAVAAGEPFTRLHQWVGTLEPGSYKITWGAPGYGSTLVYVDVQETEQGLRISSQTVYRGVAYPPGQAMNVMEWVQTLAHDFASGETANILVTEDGGGALRLSSGSLTGVYTSTIVAVGFPFNAVVAHWDADLPAGTSMRAELRVFATGTGWSDWHSMDGVEWSVEKGQFYPQSPLLLADGRQFQYRVTMAVQLPGEPGAVSPVLREMTVTYMDTHEGPTTLQAKAMAQAGLPTAGGVPKPGIIPRIGWGADESYRTWEPEYRVVQKVVIHHTVTPSSYPEEQAASWVRAIYYYHAVTRGWGDIGYNYLVDQYGNIYEGRYGGPGVVGGHVSSFNYGTVGIGLLGTFGNYPDSASPTDVLLSSLARLCAWEASRSTIHPLGRSQFRDISPPDLAGHRDYPPYSTTCPGDLVFAELPKVRAATWDRMQSYTARYGAEWLAWRSSEGAVESGTLLADQTYTVALQVRNSGWFVWPHGGTYPVHLRYRWLDSIGKPVPQAAESPGLPLNEDLPFGQVYEFVSVPIRAPAHTGTYALVWDMVHEGQGRFHDLNPSSMVLSMTVVVADVRPTATPTPVPIPSPTSAPRPRGVQNGGFEGTWAWAMPETACTARYTGRIVHSGRGALQTGAEDSNLAARCYSSADQTLVVPVAPSITLSYWYQARVDRGDHAYVYIRPEGGAWRLLGAVRQDQPSWTRATFGLNAYSGRMVTLRFGTYNDSLHGASVMFVDDVALVLDGMPAPTPLVTTPPPSVTPTPAAPTATGTPTLGATVTPMPTPTPARCSELAANGDFEVDAGWRILNTPYKARYTDVMARTGHHALQLGIPNSGENRLSFSSAEQQFRVPDGAAATLSLWYRMPNNGGSGDYGYLLIRPSGSSWRVLRMVRLRTPDWTLISVDVSHYAGQGFDLRLGTYNNGATDGGVAVMYVDSLSLRACMP